MTVPLYEIERDADGMPLRMYWCGFGPSLKEQEMNWREASAIIIRKVIAETGNKDLHLLKAKLREAYPWGERAMWPYKIWLDEIKRQLGTKPPLRRGGRKPEPVPAEQGKLFV